jgi:hypothetical protein
MRFAPVRNGGADGERLLGEMELDSTRLFVSNRSNATSAMSGNSILVSWALAGDRRSCLHPYSTTSLFGSITKLCG